MCSEIDQNLLQHLEAVLFASDTALTLERLSQAFADQYTGKQIKQHLAVLAEQHQSRAVALVEHAQGYQFQVKAEFNASIKRLWPDKPIRLSNTLLETLSVIAYHQPVTRSDIEYIRGVSINSQALRTLFDWQWIKESGFKDTPGKPALLVTTKQFLVAFGIQALSELPPMQDTTTTTLNDEHIGQIS